MRPRSQFSRPNQWRQSQSGVDVKEPSWITTPGSAAAVVSAAGQLLEDNSRPPGAPPIAGRARQCLIEARGVLGWPSMASPLTSLDSLKQYRFRRDPGTIIVGIPKAVQV